MEVDGVVVDPNKVSIHSSGDEPVSAVEITPDHPINLSVGVLLTVRVHQIAPGKGKLRFTIDTLEVGSLSFSVATRKKVGKKSQEKRRFRIPSLSKRPFKVDVHLDAETVIGEINPYIYGHFVEHLERCVYGGIWTEDGSVLREDTLELIKAIKPPVIRYPGGNFASGYHWEDGVGPKEDRPERFDEAWKTKESNQVGTDEFMTFCKQVGSDPFLVVNCGNGTAEEAANWVAYCNESAEGDYGKRRAKNGHPEPYAVKLWGVGNEVWGPWQIGHSTAEEYAVKLRQFAVAMREVDPSIQIVAVGDKVLTDEDGDPGRLWNEIVLREAGDLLDHISFHLYQPDREGWRESYDQDELHHIVCAAPVDVERIIRRIAAQIETLQPDRDICIAFDEWNLWLPPPDGADSMHELEYTMRDVLYTAGMLNVFQRQCHVVSVANLAQLVNVLPLIVTDVGGAYASPLYYPFQLYTKMESISLQVDVVGKFYDTLTLGNISALKDVPYFDVTATCDADRERIVLGMVNRHPTSRVFLNVALSGFEDMALAGGWLLRHSDPLAVNSFENPVNIRSRKIEMPPRSGKRFRLDLPPASVSTIMMKRKS
jgi:alpha-N-arabinofuranosidase